MIWWMAAGIVVGALVTYPVLRAPVWLVRRFGR
jgi:hypothetical protein